MSTFFDSDEMEDGDICDPVCALCGCSDWRMYGKHAICEDCVMDAANQYIYETSGKYDWRFATDEQLLKQAERDNRFKQKQKKTIPASLRTLVFERDEYRCLCCGSHKRLRCDHVIPESEGGAMHESNMQTLCESCNCKKGTKRTDYRKNTSTVDADVSLTHKS